MADTNNISASQDAPVKENAQSVENAPAGNSTQAGADDLAKLADAATNEGSSINSEDYWFLKLNGNC